VGVPHSLADLGVDREQRDLVATMAVVDPTAAGNPRPLTVAAAADLFDAAWAGRLAGG
jgi:alcohol dehydrogenase class IV